MLTPADTKDYIKIDSPDTKIALQPLIKSICRAMAYGL
jgi:hypothetical protein